MNVENLEKRVRHYISLRHEGETWDFKRQWYAKDKGKADLLHDIICMTNTIENEDGLIIIGVDEENGYTIRDVQEDSNRKDTQKMISWRGCLTCSRARSSTASSMAWRRCWIRRDDTAACR